VVKALVARNPRSKLEPFEFSPGELRPRQVEIDVSSCGICHSDLSMLDNEWGMSQFPLVPGHEVVGKVCAVGGEVRHLKPGQTVGLGWFSGSCMTCPRCMAGDHNLCGSAEQTIVGRYGGFAAKVRANAEWAIPLPDGVDSGSAGPLFCGGITVFNPIVQFAVKPTDRAGVIGIGGLGHLALKFLRAWGCHVTAFTSSDSKRDEAMRLGAHAVVNSRDSGQMKRLSGSLDFILSTVNASLDWEAVIAALAPRGRLHLVGAVLEPIPLSVFSLLGGQKQVSASPLGSPATTAAMLDFCARHRIAPVVERFPMSRANDALDRLRSGKARYRIVLDNDLG